MSSIILVTFLLVAVFGMPLTFALGFTALLALSFSGWPSTCCHSA